MMFVLGVVGGFWGAFWFGFVCLLGGLGLVLLLFVFPRSHLSAQGPEELIWMAQCSLPVRKYLVKTVYEQLLLEDSVAAFNHR